MRGLWSQVEEAWRDTLVHKAEGFPFRNLAMLYGIPHPTAEIPELNWRGVVSTLAYGRRGVFQDTYSAVQKAFDFLAYDIVADISSESGRVILVSDSWEQKHVNRLIKYEDKLYFSENLYDVNKLSLVPISTSYWEGASVDDLPPMEGVTVRVLAFVVHERNPGRSIILGLEGTPSGSEDFSFGQECLFEVILFENEEDLVPKTWLQAPSDYSLEITIPTPEGVPYGGAALLDETILGNPFGTGPHPLYAYSGQVYSQTSKVLSTTLASSVELRVVANPPPLFTTPPENTPPWLR